MWLLHFLPDSYLEFIVNAVLLTGVVSTVLTCFFLKYLVRLIPTLAPWTFAAQAVSIAILLSGVYFRGGYSTEMLWRERVAEVEQQLKEAKQRSEDLNNDLIELAQKKTKYIRGRTEYITQYIDQNLGQYDERFSKNGICAIPQEFVNAHNKAARKPETK